MRSLHSAALSALGLLALAAAAPAKDKQAALPATDPPAVLGDPYVAEGVTYVPADAPFDDVGHAGLDDGAGPGISVSHRTLPLPSYVEVTALDSGRTILARVDRRGPAMGRQLIGLSAGGFAQLGADPAVPLAVRVRRVNPQEYERALLRTNQRAPERLVTPGPLVEVLRNLLARKGGAGPVRAAGAPPAEPAPVSATPPAEPLPIKASPPRPAPVKPAAPSAGSAFAVQVAAFAHRANADATARKLGGTVIGSGRLWRVELGPFADRGAAQAGLARARNAGFGDARLVSARK